MKVIKKKSDEFVEMKPEWIDYFENVVSDWPKQKNGFFLWAKKNKCPRNGQHHLKRMKNGSPTPKDIAWNWTAHVYEIRVKNPERYPDLIGIVNLFDEFFESVDANRFIQPPTLFDDGAALIEWAMDFWRSQGMAEVFSFETTNCKLKSEKAVLEFWDQMILTAGVHRMRQDKVRIESARQAIAYELVRFPFDCQPDDLKEAAVQWWRKHPTTHLQSSTGEGKKKRNVGGFTILPLVVDVYQAVRNGELRLNEISPNDLDEYSEYFLIAAAPEYFNRVSRVTRFTHEVRLIVTAMASMMPPLEESNGETDALNLLTFAGTPGTKVILKRRRFKQLEGCLKGTTCELFEMKTGDNLFLDRMTMHVREAQRAIRGDLEPIPESFSEMDSEYLMWEEDPHS